VDQGEKLLDVTGIRTPDLRLQLAANPNTSRQVSHVERSTRAYKAEIKLPVS